jgi:predicted amidohydrolase YtcJ
MPWVEAIAMRDGRVVARGSAAQIASVTKGWVDVRTVDLNGRLVIPGLNDAHMHHTPDPRGIRLPIDPVADPDFPTIQPLILEAVSASAADTWIYGVMGERLINDNQLTRRELDKLAPEHPVILLGLTNHTNVVNTAAMRRLGIEENEPDPLGGFFERFPNSSIVSGRINEYAQWAPQRCFALMATIGEGVESLVRLAADCASFGITTLQNMSWTPVDRYVEMLKAANLSIRIRVIRFPPSGPKGRYLGEGAAQPKFVAPRIEVSGTKWILDGTTVERAAALGRPYADSPQTRGRINFPNHEIRVMLAESLRSGDQLLLHAIGTETLEAVISAVESFGSNVDWEARGLRIEHADGLTKDQIRRVKTLKLKIVQNPSHFLFPEVYGPRFGEAALYAAFRRLLDAEISMGIGSDGPLNPYLGIMAAVLHPANPNEAISVSDVIYAYTMGSAKAEGKADEKGALAPGYIADCAILSQDIFTVDPSLLPETRSLMTIVDGHVIHESIA